MWRLTRYLAAFASGQALEAWLSARIDRPNYAEAGRRAGEKLDEAADRIARYLEERERRA